MSEVTVSISLTKKEQGALYMNHLKAKETIKTLSAERDALIAALNKIYLETSESTIANIASAAIVKTTE